MLLSMFTFIQTAHADTAATTTAAAPSMANDPMGFLMQFALPIAFFAIFYFLIIRPQSRRNKEHRSMIDTLKEGSEVVFAGGLMGRIKKLQGDYAVIELDTTHSVKVQRASIISVLPVGTLAGLN